MSKILLVDDDDLGRAAVHKMLEHSGFSVHSTGIGRDALAHYKDDPADLVITDLIMPDTDGLEMIQQLRKINPRVRVLAISGGGRVEAEEYLSVARKFGAVGVLPKPFTATELREAVEGALADPRG
jgi:CheY-like chemotaxis protein